MKKENHVTAFYLEVLLLTVGLIGIVLVLTQIFALGRRESAEARELTDAVCLAQNAAEAFAASADPEELCAILDEGGSAELVETDSAAAVRARLTPRLRRQARRKPIRRNRQPSPSRQPSRSPRRSQKPRRKTQRSRKGAVSASLPSSARMPLRNGRTARTAATTVATVATAR